MVRLASSMGRAVRLLRPQSWRDIAEPRSGAPPNRATPFVTGWPAARQAQDSGMPSLDAADHRPNQIIEIIVEG